MTFTDTAAHSHDGTGHGDNTVRFQKKFRYHHGNLRDALIAAGTDILDAEGVAGLSLRALSKATGVSQAAPYSHFRDKEELLAAVAETGFQKLAMTMVESATGASGAKGRVEKLVIAYIAFARDNRALFSLMFGREITDMKKFPTLAMTAGKSYALISAALSRREKTDAQTSGDDKFLTVALWSYCHGLATLVADGKMDPAAFGAKDIAGFVRQSLAAFDPHF